jgi:hypothetical protein
MRRLITWEDLQPLVGVTSEGADLDFKGNLDTKDERTQLESAKDVAALANVLGGHILIGVSTDMNGTRCTGFHGLDRKKASGILKMFEEQVRDRCRPGPFVHASSIAISGGSKVVAVVSVDASPNAPVGVLLRQNKGGHLVDKGWAFPFRVASQTDYLQPDLFGAYEAMSARRIAALLDGIPQEQRNNVVLRFENPGGKDRQEASTFVSVNLSENSATFRRKDDPSHVITIPLDEIVTIWREDAGEGLWQISLSGSLNNTGGRQVWHYVPRNSWR